MNALDTDMYRSEPIGRGVTCRFVAAPRGGTPPYTYIWSISGSGFSPSGGTGQTFSTRNYSTYMGTSNYQITLRVTDAYGVSYSTTAVGSIAGSGSGYDTTYCG